MLRSCKFSYMGVLVYLTAMLLSNHKLRKMCDYSQKSYSIYQEAGTKQSKGTLPNGSGGWKD